MTNNETKHVPLRAALNGPWPESEGSPLRAAAESATRPDLPPDLRRLAGALERGEVTAESAVSEAYGLGRHDGYEEGYAVGYDSSSTVWL